MTAALQAGSDTAPCTMAIVGHVQTYLYAAVVSVTYREDRIMAMSPDAKDKTDITLGRPTLPLTYAALCSSGTQVDNNATRAALWNNGAIYLAWAVAETYRQQALDLIAELTTDPLSRSELAGLLPKLDWTKENGT
jgi:hypothetical protein